MKKASDTPPEGDDDAPIARALNPEEDEPDDGPREPDGVVLRWLLSYLGRHRLMTAVVYVSIVVTALLGFAVLPFTKLLMDAVQQLEAPAGLHRVLEATTLGRAVIALGLDDTPLEVVTLAAALLLTAKLLHAAVGFANHYLDEVLTGRVLRDLRDDLFTHILDLPDDYFHEHGVGELMTRFVQDLNGVVSIYGMVFFAPLIDVVTLLVSSIYLLSLDPLLGGLVLLFAPIYYLVSGPLAKRLQARVVGVSEQFAAVNDDLQETLSAIREIKAHGAQARERAEFQANLDRHYRATLDYRWWGLVAGQATKLISEAAPVLLLAIGALMIVRYHTITLGTLIVVFGSVGSVIGAMSSLSNVGIGYKGALAYARQVRKVLAEPTERARFTGTRALQVPERPDPEVPALSFENVSMIYPRTGYMVSDVSFKVLPGQTVAIVGEGGAGKSTVFNLLFKLYPYQTGSVKVHGQELSELDVGSTRRAFGFMQQFPFFFQRSYRENLQYGSEATDAAVTARFEQLCRELGLNDVAGAMSKGFESTITNRGANLSGSQQKRSALVRSLLRDPPFLLLDEPLSGLSPEQRRDVVGRIRSLARGKTVLMITHDLDLIKEVDLILVFQRQALSVADALPLAGTPDAVAQPLGDDAVAQAPGDGADGPPAAGELPSHGVLVEQGTYAELSAHGAVFRRLIDQH